MTSRRRWTAKEDAAVRAAAMACVPWPDVARRLDRTAASVRNRAAVIGASRPPPERWTAEEDAAVCDMRLAGRPGRPGRPGKRHDVAGPFKATPTRTRHQVRMRAVALGLRTTPPPMYAPPDITSDIARNILTAGPLPTPAVAERTLDALTAAGILRTPTELAVELALQETASTFVYEHLSEMARESGAAGQDDADAETQARRIARRFANRHTEDEIRQTVTARVKAIKSHVNRVTQDALTLDYNNAKARMNGGIAAMLRWAALTGEAGIALRPGDRLETVDES